MYELVSSDKICVSDFGLFQYIIVWFVIDLYIVIAIMRISYMSFHNINKI